MGEPTRFIIIRTPRPSHDACHNCPGIEQGCSREIERARLFDCDYAVARARARASVADEWKRRPSLVPFMHPRAISKAPFHAREGVPSLGGPSARELRMCSVRAIMRRLADRRSIVVIRRLFSNLIISIFKTHIYIYIIHIT